MSKQIASVRVGSRVLQLSNLHKVLYPQTGFTKGDVINYYAAIADTIIPHIGNRALTLKRYPNGVDQGFFYEKQCPRHRPDWVDTAAVDRTSTDDQIHYCLIADKPALVWVANLASIELHVLLSTVPDVMRPTHMAFDFDPGPGTTIMDCARVAFNLRDLFETIGLKSFPKTSGKKGLHLYVPLNTAVTFNQTKPFAHAVAMALERQSPDRVVSNMRKALRKNKVFVDWSQNDDHKTTVAPYSLRAWDRPTVSTPLTWDELERAYKKKDPQQLIFAPADVEKRLKKWGDLFKPLLTMKQTLPSNLSTAKKKAAARSDDALKTYRQKRDFSITPEPDGPPPKELKGMKLHRFVIQKHDATRLHYDFRLETQGVLKSWAVPKGPSTNPSDKRLAMMTEDHPLDYAGFEGVIPEGEYGGGPVMVWDTGTYVNLTEDKIKKGKIVPLPAGIAKGHIDFWLNGKKLKGAWSLIRTAGDDPRRWLMIKKKDAAAYEPENPEEELPDSVLTGRSIDEILNDAKSKVWHSNR